MRLEPETVSVLTTHACNATDSVTERIADDIHLETGIELNDDQYSDLSAALEDAIATALGNLDL